MERVRQKWHLKPEVHGQPKQARQPVLKGKRGYSTYCKEGIVLSVKKWARTGKHGRMKRQKKKNMQFSTFFWSGPHCHHGVFRALTPIGQVFASWLSVDGNRALHFTTVQWRVSQTERAWMLGKQKSQFLQHILIPNIIPKFSISPITEQPQQGISKICKLEPKIAQDGKYPWPSLTSMTSYKKSKEKKKT